MSLLDPNDPRFKLGRTDMDQTHDEFIQQLNAIMGMEGVEFVRGIIALHEHTLAHFGHEDTLMNASGFPPAPLHQAEHTLVLQRMAEVKVAAEKGDIEQGKAFLRDWLAPWFVQHALSMDTALANHLNRSSLHV